AQALCERIDEVDGRSASSFGQGLLALAFGRGERPFAKRCVEILETLASSATFWDSSVDASEVLATWNLPRSREALAAFAADAASQADPEAWLHAKLHAGA